MKYIATIGEQQYTIIINDDSKIMIDDEEFPINFEQLTDTTLFSLIIDEKSYDVNVDQDDEAYHVVLKGKLYDVTVEDERTRRLAGLKGIVGDDVGEALIKAPMPGVVVDIRKQPGDDVKKGEIVIILESMKMQNEFKAPKDGVISSIRVKTGQAVEQKSIMVTIS